MQQRARSVEAKALRSEALLVAAEELAVELGGVRFVTLAPVTERAGIHRTGVRRYYASKEELLLELAERGWSQWREAVDHRLREATRDAVLTPREVASIVADTLVALPVFCDLLSHVAVSLEGDVDLARSRRYKTASFAEHDHMVDALADASALTRAQLTALIAAALAFAAHFWQIAHPTVALRALYAEHPEWGHVALGFEARMHDLLTALATGLASD